VHLLAFIKPQNTQLKCTVCNGHLLTLAHKKHAPYIKQIINAALTFWLFTNIAFVGRAIDIIPVPRVGVHFNAVLILLRGRFSCIPVDKIHCSVVQPKPFS